MATYSKPTKIPRWNDDLANNVEPPEAKKDLGWVFEEEPPSSFENWKEQLNGQWWKWINERFADGASADELVILSPATAAEMFKISNAIAKWSSAAGIEFESVAGIFTAGRSVTDGINLKGIGSTKHIEFNGTLNRMSYNVTSDVWSLFNNSATASMTVDETTIVLKKAVTAEQLISADEGVTAALNKHITVRGTGQFKHGNRVANLAAMDWVAPQGFVGATLNFGLTVVSEVSVSGVSKECYQMIRPVIGERFKTIDVEVFGGGVSQDRILDLMYSNAAGTETSVATSGITSTDGYYTISLAGLAEDVIAGRYYYLKFRTSVDFVIPDRISGTTITYDLP